MGFKGITITTSEESLGNITAADDAAIFQSLIGSDGVLNIGSKFATTVISNNKVRVADGVMCVGGHMGRTAYGDYNDMTIENGVSGQNRNDIIYAKFLTSGSADTFTLNVKKGTGTTGTATDPALTQGVLYENATLREFPLWRVKLKGLSIVAVEQMFTLVPTIPELEAKFNKLNTNLGYIKSSVKNAITVQNGSLVDAYIENGCVCIRHQLPQGVTGGALELFTIETKYAPRIPISGVIQITGSGSDTNKVYGSDIGADGKCEVWINQALVHVVYVTFCYPLRTIV